MRIHVIGNRDCVLGMALAGVEGRVVRDALELERALESSLADPGVALLLVTSDVADLARHRIDALKVSNLQPLVVEIPASTPSAAPALRDFVQRAVGIGLGGR
jgi:vacuolar-type H+-ATPase subunit F/Vma7